MNFVSIYFLHFVAAFQSLVVITCKLHGLDTWFLLCGFGCCLLRVFLLLGFSSSLAEDVAHGLVLFPGLELALARAVPHILAPGASLGSESTADSALRIFHKVLIDIISVEFEHSVHVFFGLLSVFGKECDGLHGSNFLKVFALHNAGPQLG